MTNLTEQWKKGELLKGFYYYELPSGETDICTDFKLAMFLMCKDGDKIEVLEPVPSYEQWKSSDKLILTLMDNIKDKSDLLQQAMVKNAELKELLKECYVAINEGLYWDQCEMLHKIDQVLGEE